MVDVLRIFYQARGANPWFVLVCLLLAGISEGVGLATLLPLLSIAINDNTHNNSTIALYLRNILGLVGLEPRLEVLLLLVVGGIVAKCLLNMAAMAYVGNSVAKVATGLRAELLDHLLKARWSYFTSQPLGRIANAVSAEATRAGQAYLMAASLVALIIQMAIYSIVAALVSWKLSLVALAIGSVIAFSLNFLVRLSRKAGRRQTERTSELVVYLSDALSNIKPLKAMDKAAKFANLFDRKIRQLKKSLRNQVTSQYALRNIEEILVAATIGAGFYVATIEASVPISQLLVMGVVVYQAISSVGKLQRQYQKAVLYESPYLTVRALIDEVEAAREPNPGTAVPTLEQGCRFDAVSFGFGKAVVLDRASLDIPANGLTVITGSSGAGKTTLTDLLLGLQQPAGGRILLDGRPLTEIDLQAWRGMVGYVPQELILFHDSVLANVTLGDLKLGPDEVKHALEAAGAWEFVSALPEGLETVVGEKGAKLSGGQRQRIALARALAGQPKLLILDEVTSALDPDTERDICRNIDALSHNMTILAITHREAWTDIAERAYRLADGKAELIKDGRSLKRPA